MGSKKRGEAASPVCTPATASISAHCISLGCAGSVGHARCPAVSVLLLLRLACAKPGLAARATPVSDRFHAWDTKVLHADCSSAPACGSDCMRCCLRRLLPRLTCMSACPFSRDPAPVGSRTTALLACRPEYLRQLQLAGQPAAGAAGAASGPGLGPTPSSASTAAAAADAHAQLLQALNGHAAVAAAAAAGPRGLGPSGLGSAGLATAGSLASGNLAAPRAVRPQDSHAPMQLADLALALRKQAAAPLPGTSGASAFSQPAANGWNSDNGGGGNGGGTPSRTAAMRRQGSNGLRRQGSDGLRRGSSGSLPGSARGTPGAQLFRHPHPYFHKYKRIVKPPA